MKSYLLIQLAVGVLLLLPVSTAQLTCENFTEAYQDDCDYITAFPGLNDSDEQQLLEQLLSETYEADYELYAPPPTDEIGLMILTTKRTYLVNDTIRVIIYPQDTPVTLTYGNETITTQNTALFIAQAGQISLHAQYGSETYTRPIGILETTRLATLTKLAFTGLIFYLALTYATRSLTFQKWLVAFST